MAYIIFVNPSILHEAGMPLAAVTAATCLCAAFGSILMGVYRALSHCARSWHGPERLLHLHRGERHGRAWQTALGAVFLSGVAFVIAHRWSGVRQMIVARDPGGAVLRPSRRASACSSRSSDCATRGSS